MKNTRSAAVISAAVICFSVGLSGMVIIVMSNIASAMDVAKSRIRQVIVALAVLMFPISVDFCILRISCRCRFLSGTWRGVRGVRLFLWGCSRSLSGLGVS